MRTFIIATDHHQNPTKSALLVGLERPDDDVRRQFYAMRAEGFHPEGWQVLELHNQTGIESVSIARWKDSKEKAKALSEEKAKAEAEAKAVADADSARKTKLEKERKQ